MTSNTISWHNEKKNEFFHMKMKKKRKKQLIKIKSRDALEDHLKEILWIMIWWKKIKEKLNQTNERNKSLNAAVGYPLYTLFAHKKKIREERITE